MSSHNSDVSMTGFTCLVTPGEHQRELMRVIQRELASSAHYIDPHQLEQAKTSLKMNSLSSIDGTTVVGLPIHIHNCFLCDCQ